MCWLNLGFDSIALFRDRFKCPFLVITSLSFPRFLTRELRAYARASCKYDVENGTRSLARSIGRFQRLAGMQGFTLK